MAKGSHFGAVGCALCVAGVVPTAHLLGVKAGRQLAANRTFFFEINPDRNEANEYSEYADAEKSHGSASEKGECSYPKQDNRQHINFAS